MGTTRTFEEALKFAQLECETALTEFLGTDVEFHPIEWIECHADELLSVVGQFVGVEEVYRAIVVGVYGDLQGYLVMFFPIKDAEELAAYMLDGESDPEIQESVLAEIGNLTTARLLMGFSKAIKTNGEALPTPPQTHVDFSGSLLQSLSALLLSQGQVKVFHSVWKLQIQLPKGTVNGTAHFFLPM
ncbi:hypothetical protein [Fervidibacter sacchari]